MKFASVVLVHLGGVHSLRHSDATWFLREFLGDEFVLSIPYLLRKFLAWRISKKRSSHFLEMLKSCAIKTKDGVLPASLFHAKNLAKNLAKELAKELQINVFEAGVYGENNLANLRKKFEKENLLGGKILFIICYPQIASSTVFPAIREIEKHFKDCEFKIAKGYASMPEYSEAIASSILEKNEKFDAVITSFHSIPKSQQIFYDYDSECKNTFFEIKKILGESRVEFAYQSAMKFGKWLEPSVFDVAKNLAEAGAKSIAVVCPAFFCDCTETLIEIDRDLRTHFLKCGGEKFSYINCLNSSSLQVKLFTEIVKRENICDV